MNLKPNLLGPLISHLQNNTMDNNSKNNNNYAINAEMTKCSSPVICKTPFDPAMHEVV